ncbi:MAG: hypothetical protein MZV64_02255 [Ignavibacteriales bacterium]|nr:hypothetical protein [Ignavibacteriales bacterium]
MPPSSPWACSLLASGNDLIRADAGMDGGTTRLGHGHAGVALHGRVSLARWSSSLLWLLTVATGLSACGQNSKHGCCTSPAKPRLRSSPPSDRCGKESRETAGNNPQPHRRRKRPSITARIPHLLQVGMIRKTRNLPSLCRAAKTCRR